MCTEFEFTSFSGYRIKYGSYILDAALTHPANFGLKSCFLVSYSPNLPNLKLLASTVAEISRIPTFLDASLVQTPAILVLKVV